MKTILLIIGIVVLGLSFIAPRVLKTEHFDRVRKNHLDTVHNKAAHLEHFDMDDETLEDFEVKTIQDDYFEAFEHFKKKRTPDQARTAALQSIQRKHGANKVSQAMKQTGSVAKNPASIGNNPFYDAAAQFDITVTRVTAAIAQALPIPLFATIHFDAKYASIMGNYLPAGVTISGIAVDATGSVVFSLTDGVGTDTIKVSCTQIPYISFLNALNNTQMKFSKVRYAISDVTKLNQFQQLFETYYKSIFGKHGGNGLSLAAVNDPRNLNNGVRDLDNVIEVNNETAVVIGIINTAGFSVCVSSFVQAYSKNNR